MIVGMCCLVAAAQKASTARTTLSRPTSQPGDVVRLDVACACEASAASAAAFGRDVPLFRAGDEWHALIGIDLDVRPGTYPVAVTLHHDGGSLTKTTHNLVVVNKQFPTRRLTVEPAFVEPPQSELARIEKEAIDLQTLYADARRPRQWDGAFAAPVDARPNSNFGSRSVFNGQARNPHAGTDFAAGTGTPVVAPAAGIVVLSASLYFTGNTVVIDHGLGLYSVLAHLSEFAVKQGDRVERGDRVGLVGATGRVTAPHLHWSVRLNSARVDPLSLMSVTKVISNSSRPQTPTKP
jgi:murein DD-endopeptidase MepM/ murein hydrolase activator NlpD